MDPLRSVVRGKDVGVNLVFEPSQSGKCGVGPFVGTINDVELDMLVIGLRDPISYEHNELLTIIAKPRHAPGTLDALTAGRRLSANLTLLRSTLTSATELNDDTRSGCVAGIGTVEIT